jgi:hypothetical protein
MGMGMGMGHARSFPPVLPLDGFAVSAMPGEAWGSAGDEGGGTTCAHSHTQGGALLVASKALTEHILCNLTAIIMPDLVPDSPVGSCNV